MSVCFRDLLRRTRDTQPSSGRETATFPLRETHRTGTPAVSLLAAWALLQAGWRGSSRLPVYEIAQDGLLSAASTASQAARPVDPNDEVEAAWMEQWDQPLAERTAVPIVVGVDDTRRQLSVCFDTAIMSRDQAETLLGCLAAVAEAIHSGPEAHVDSVDLTGGRRVVAEVFPYDHSTSIASVFSDVASRHGDRTALVHGDVRVTYRSLNARADAIAASLGRGGVRPGSTVAIALERSVDAVSAMIGIVKAGCAFMPIDVSFPSSRVSAMIDAANPVAAITLEAHRHVLPPALKTFLVDECANVASSAADAALSDGDSIAYVMFTSGSTGKPKGVQVFHKSIMRLVRGSHFADLSSSCVMLQAAPLGFDASTLEIWGPLLNGGCCVIHGEDVPTPDGLRRTIRANGVTTAWLTSGLFNSIVDDNPDVLAGLEQLVIGGEALSVAHVRRFLAAQPHVELINGYGPTECTTFTTTYSIPVDLADGVTAIPIGRPIGATTTYVLSPSLQQVPPGIAGELFVGGLGVAKGYVNDDQLTQERFIDNPFGPQGDRLYRTGDQVRVGVDGNLEFLGRADRQVKVRGFRIELAEVELALATHPQVRSAVVVVDHDRARNARLIAYVVSAGSVSPAALREHVASRLPSPMVPAHFVSMASLPLTANGKVDRAALPPAPHDRPEMAEPFREPINDAERAICSAFSEALEVSRVGRFDNFFELGGNSLLMLRVLTQLERNGLKRLPTTAFFKKPTPASLSRYLQVERPRRSEAPPSRSVAGTNDDAVAIIAMAGRFPGANSIDEFWQNLREGRDTIRTFTDTELDASVPPERLADPAYVKRRGVMHGAEMFDAAFFGMTPRAAELMDPQQRVFLEICWECLERGGYAPDHTRSVVGVFAGMYNASYFQHHLANRRDLVDAFGEFQVMLANEKDYLASRVAHKLNLVGPAISVYTACSTSLVAIAQAHAALRSGQCELALAGGVSITCPINSGYLYQEGAMLSPDGVTRTFDAHAAGTVFSDGAGVVLLKRLRDAIADGDSIHAVIRGVAVNNDGRDKASFTAPSVAGQAAVIRQALRNGGIAARDLSTSKRTAPPLRSVIRLRSRPWPTCSVRPVPLRRRAESAPSRATSGIS